MCHKRVQFTAHSDIQGSKRHVAASLGCRAVYGRAITLVTPSKPMPPVLIRSQQSAQPSFKCTQAVNQICSILYKRQQTEAAASSHPTHNSRAN
jgi:hypothetical protein